MSIASTQTVHLDTEIRKLQPATIYKLTMLLNVQDSWKKLMAIVPKDDGSGNYKFNSEHISLIKQGSRQLQRGSAEIFLDEWGTMGKKRPTVEKLLDLLTKAELYRAADYIAIEVLNWKEGPKRPESGPAAQIDIDSLLLESRDDIVESSSSIVGDVFNGPSFLNDVQNLRESVPQGEQMSCQIPAFLKDTNFSSMIVSSQIEKSFEKTNSISTESCTSGTANELHSNRSSEVEAEKLSSKLPRCLLNMSLSSQSVEITSSKTSNESSHSASGNESPNVMIPRLILDYSISE